MKNSRFLHVFFITYSPIIHHYGLKLTISSGESQKNHLVPFFCFILFELHDLGEKSIPFFVNLHVVKGFCTGPIGHSMKLKSPSNARLLICHTSLSASASSSITQKYHFQVLLNNVPILNSIIHTNPLIFRIVSLLVEISDISFLGYFFQEH